MAHAVRLGRFAIHLLVISDHLGVAACRVLYRTNGHILRANHHFAATSAPEKKLEAAVAVALCTLAYLCIHIGNRMSIR
jgi:hypothetical protein